MDYFSSEYINPFDEKNPDFWMKAEHLGRYLYAAHRLEKFAKSRAGADLSHLDVGCANGYGLKILTNSAKNLTGVDYNKDALKKAAKTCPEATLHHLDMDKTSLTNIQEAPFTSITAFEVLEHLEDPKKTTRELSHLLIKGGLLLASFPNPTYERLDETGTPENPYHHHAQTLEESTKMFEDAGFEVKQTLGQPLCNQLFSRERNLHKNGTITEKPFSNPALNTPDRIQTLANLFAWPEETNLEKSYTFIFELIKK